jgi:hypothetical protein
MDPRVRAEPDGRRLTLEDAGLADRSCPLPQTVVAPCRLRSVVQVPLDLGPMLSDGAALETAEVARRLTPVVKAEGGQRSCQALFLLPAILVAPGVMRPAVFLAAPGVMRPRGSGASDQRGESEQDP